jgi:hypothetical protein
VALKIHPQKNRSEAAFKARGVRIGPHASRIPSFHNVTKNGKSELQKPVIGTLIHSCCPQKQQPVLGQYSIGTLGQYSVGINTIKGRQGKQFAIILGDIDKATGIFSAQQTRIVLNKCVPPSINGIELIFTPYKGSRVAAQDSKLTLDNQTSCLVADETALTELLRWYARHEVRS